VQGYDTLIGRAVEVEADLVVLANGVTSARGSVELMQTLGISYDGYGFINEAHVKLRPVETEHGRHLPRWLRCWPQGHP